MDGVTSSKHSPGFLILGVFAFAVITLSTPQAFAQTAAGAGSNFTIVAGDNILNDPVASQILRNIEISKQRLAQMMEAEEQRTAHQRHVDEQRRLVQEQLERDLANMNRNNEAHTPRNAFTTFLAGTNSTHHAIYWDQFDYMTEKVRLASDAKEAVLRSGGSSAEAHQEFIKYASMSRTEMVSFISDLNVRHGFTNEALQSHFDADGKLPRYGSDELDVCYSCDQYEEIREQMLMEHERQRSQSPIRN